jgi:hypothetical protein
MELGVWPSECSIEYLRRSGQESLRGRMYLIPLSWRSPCPVCDVRSSCQSNKRLFGRFIVEGHSSEHLERSTLWRAAANEGSGIADTRPHSWSWVPIDVPTYETLFTGMERTSGRRGRSECVLIAANLRLLIDVGIAVAEIEKHLRALHQCRNEAIGGHVSTHSPLNRSPDFVDVNGSIEVDPVTPLVFRTHSVALHLAGADSRECIDGGCVQPRTRGSNYTRPI